MTYAVQHLSREEMGEARSFSEFKDWEIKRMIALIRVGKKMRAERRK